MKYQLLPPLSAEEYGALERSIVEHGVLVPVEYDEAGEIIDGHHRVAVCESLGIKDWPRIVRAGMSEAEKRAHARELNLARRHLTTFQKRALIEAQIIDTPHLSSRALALALGVDNHTVMTLRRKLEGDGRVSSTGKVTGRDGRLQPARKPALSPSPILSDGVRVDGLAYHQVLARIADCKRDLALLEPIVSHGNPVDDQMTARQIMPPSYFEVGRA